MLKIVIFVVCGIFLAVSEPTKDEACPAVNSDVVTFLAHETDRQSFYICDNGYKIAMKCPGELLWNESTKTCDFSFNVDQEDSGESGGISSESSSSEESEEYSDGFESEVLVLDFEKLAGEKIELEAVADDEKPDINGV